MKKSQFASLHAGMLVRASAPSAARPQRIAEQRFADTPRAEPIEPAEPNAAAAAATATAEALSPVWRSDGPMAIDSWEHLRAELLPPGWGRSSAASEPTMSVVGDETETSVASSSIGESEHRPQRQRGGFGRRATPPPSADEADDEAPTVGESEPDAATVMAEAVVDTGDASLDEPVAELDIPALPAPAASDFADLDVIGAADDDDGEYDFIDVDADDDDFVDAGADAHADALADAGDDEGDDDHADAETAEAGYAATAAANAATVAQPTFATGRRKAMTVRLDPPRHRRLRLAGVYYGRSCQDLMVTALDAYLGQLGFGADKEN